MNVRFTAKATLSGFPISRELKNVEPSHPGIADLMLAVAAINAWNRLAIVARTVPGKYQPAKAHSVQKTA